MTDSASPPQVLKFSRAAAKGTRPSGRVKSQSMRDPRIEVTLSFTDDIASQHPLKNHKFSEVNVVNLQTVKTLIVKNST